MPSHLANKEFFGQPKGLSVLFFTEMWERFSYYGMRAILILYMVSPNGLGFSVAAAAQIYGLYTMSVYFFSLPGGWIADRFIGARQAVLSGGVLIALGHFAMAYDALETFFLGLILIVLGTGLLKPSISALVGGLYSKEDTRRDAGFSLFYMGINIGGFLAPFVCGYLGQKVSWHYGFGAAGIGMTLGLLQYLWGRKTLEEVSLAKQEVLSDDTPLTRPEKFRLGVIFILFFFSALFWMGFEQAGSSLNLFASHMTRDEFLGFHYPSSWLQAINPVYIIMLAPVISWVWVKLGTKQPSSAIKFSLGLSFAGLGFMLLSWASTFTSSGPVSPLWLAGVYLLLTLGELCLSPVGLSMVTRLAPRKLVSRMMGVWFVSIALGNYAAGWVASFFDTSSQNLVSLFSNVGWTMLSAAVLLILLSPLINRLERPDNCRDKPCQCS